MAKLIELRVKDFRAFRAAQATFSPNGPTLIAGPNNSGKSALLSAFDVVGTSDVSATRRHAQGDDIRVWARWQLTEDEISLMQPRDPNFLQRIISEGMADGLEWEFGEFQGHLQPISISVARKDGLPSLTFAKIEQLGQEFKLVYADPPLKQETKPEQDFRPSRIRRRRGGTPNPYPRISIVFPNKTTWDGETFKEYHGSRPLGEDPLSFFSLIGHEVFIGPATLAAHSILTQWRQGYYHFKPLRESYGREAPLANISPTLESSGANLATVLLYLQTNEPQTWRHLNALVQKIVPGVGNLMTPVRDNTCSVVFEDVWIPGHHHNLKDLGTGVEQLLMTLVVGLTQTATTVILEEPETGLHPGAQRALLDLIQEWSKDRLFIASTHSATMLDWHSPTTSILAVTRTGPESSVELVTTNRMAVFHELDVRLSDLLSAERILILEGPTDKAIFEAWFPDVIRDPRAAVLAGGGGFNSRHADTLASWLAETDLLARRVLYVRDRDELSTDTITRLEASEHVYVLPARELENLMLDFPALAEVISAKLARRGQPAVAFDEISRTARTLADALQPTVVLRRVMADLTEPIRLVDNSLRRQLIKQQAGEAELTAAVLARVPDKDAVASDISMSWAHHAAEVSDTWDAAWTNLVPGADLLNALWNHYLNEGYSKSSDGLAVAESMQTPPPILTEVIRKFAQ